MMRLYSSLFNVMSSFAIRIKVDEVELDSSCNKVNQDKVLTWWNIDDMAITQREFSTKNDKKKEVFNSYLRRA